MSNLFINESWCEIKPDGTRIGLGDSDVYETGSKTIGELYKSCVKLYGRCTSKMYIDRADGSSQHIGWVFIKREKYDDCNETYLKETWVSIHERKPEKIIKHFYLNIDEVKS